MTRRGVYQKPDVATGRRSVVRLENADALLVGLLLAVTLGLAGHALGQAAAEQAEADAPEAADAPAWPGLDRLRAAAPFAGGIVEPGPQA